MNNDLFAYTPLPADVQTALSQLGYSMAEFEDACYWRSLLSRYAKRILNTAACQASKSLSPIESKLANLAIGYFWKKSVE